jgi:capsular polysaccharide biosynthesis protein
MSQQVLDLRGSVQVVRRHRVLVGIVIALGVLIGGVYATLNPPMLTSTALIVLPRSVPSMATQVVVAQSDPVLSAARTTISPTVSLQTLRDEIEVRSLTSYVIAVTARSRSGAQAEAMADAVAQSYIADVGSARSPVGHVSAQILEQATLAAGSTPLKALIVTGLIGALGGALIGVITSLAISRKDRRLRSRDEIADSLGIPVLASLPVAHPSDAAGWTKLLADYKPGVVHAWRLRKTLQQLSLLDGAVSSAAYGNDDDDDGDGSSLTVLSLSSDPGALALGPQLAVFAASLGIPTVLLVDKHQNSAGMAGLRTACAAPQQAGSKHPSHLQVVVSDADEAKARAALTVVVTVIDGAAPQAPDVMPTTVSLLGVSAGMVTAEQLARVAVTSASSGYDIAGILVADPEPTDRTTGRIPNLVRPAQRKYPTRLKGLTTEIRR